MKINEAVWALGTMSGTSLDGVDAAAICTDGKRIEAFGPSAYRPYSGEERKVLRRALGAWPGGVGVAEAAAVTEAAHIDIMQGFEGVALGAFHGQTLAHDPRGRRTHQAGNGKKVAQALGLPIVWDFRSADMQLGGQGAPLAPFFHFACAKYLGAQTPLAFLNLGGVGNITYVDPSFDAPEEPGAVMAFDTGPANAPVNDLMQARLGRGMDKDGALAATGVARQNVVTTFLKDPYFYKMPPKSLDRGSFGDLKHRVSQLDDADAAATLLGCSAAAVAHGMEHLPTYPSRILVCGGGRRNLALMEMLDGLLDCEVSDIDVTGLDGDMLEAQAFAHLAVRVVRGLPTSGPSTTGVAGFVGGGVLSEGR